MRDVLENLKIKLNPTQVPHAKQTAYIGRVFTYNEIMRPIVQEYQPTVIDSTVVRAIQYHGLIHGMVSTKSTIDDYFDFFLNFAEEIKAYKFKYGRKA